MCAVTSFINRNSGAGKPDVLPGTSRHPARLQPGFPKLLSTEEDSNGLQLPVPKFVRKGKALALIFEQGNILTPLKKGPYLQIIDLRKRGRKKRAQEYGKKVVGVSLSMANILFSSENPAHIPLRSHLIFSM